MTLRGWKETPSSLSGPRVSRKERALMGGSAPHGRLSRAVFIWITGLVVVFGGCREEVIPCEDVGDRHVICGVKNAEDLAALPVSDWVLFGQGYGVFGAHRGNISAIDPSSERVSVLFQGGAAGLQASLEKGWGELDCPSPPSAQFSPHGIDLGSMPDGRLRLLAVNHGDGERVEFFEVTDTGEEPRVVWRGCAVAPEGSFLNDVVGLPGGGLLTTHMMEYQTNFSSTVKGLLGMETGFAYRWEPDTGFSVQPGSKGGLPNGIQISRDGQRVFLDLYLSSEVRVLDLETGEELHTLDIPLPDNLTWARDGRLLVASHLGDMADSIACMRAKGGACGMPFQIVSIDPESYATEIVFSTSGAPMGAGTAAMDIGGELLIGSFASNRLLRVPLVDSVRGMPEKE